MFGFVLQLLGHVENASRLLPPIELSFFSTSIIMSSDTESTDPLSTGNEHIDEVMMALKNNDAK